MAGEVVSGVVRGLVSTLSSPVLNEFWLLWGVEKEKAKLHSNLSAIGAVLEDAERRQVHEMAVRDWLQKLKAAAYDAEDIVDELRIEAVRRRKLENGAGMLEKVSNLSYPLVFRFSMAHKMKRLREKFDDIAKERNDFHFRAGVVDSQSQPLISISRARETCSYVIESEVYGRADEKEKLIDSLINSENETALSVIPIVGMGGLGKTTLAQLVYEDKRVATHFDRKMWVYVSEDFDVRRLLKAILESATERRVDELSIDVLQSDLRKELSEKRYLLVLDDVWNEKHVEWNKLKTWLTCGAAGSKILVTTRNDTVARITGTLPTHYLQTLSENDSWTLFEKLAKPHPDFESIGKEIVRRCGGLPLAISTLGGLMSLKNTRSEWESMKNSTLWEPQDGNDGVLPALKLSYNHLTSSLKQCFAYCALIPKGTAIAKDKLIWQWMAQGFIHSDNENEILEEKGEHFFNELVQRSLFQVKVKTNDDVHVPEYEMHDLIHDLLRSVAGTDCLILEDSTNTVSEETRHLSLHGNKWGMESKSWKVLKECEKLRSIVQMHFSRIRYYSSGDRFIDINVCLSLRCLRVLDLSYMGLGYLPNSIDKLKHLRYLDVTGTFIEILPETICNLHSLQTLIISSCRKIRKLPKDMKTMTSLRHIVFDVWSHLSLPKGIGKLTGLRKLSKFVVGKDSGRGIEELKGLNQLLGHFHIEGLYNIINGACGREADLKAKQHLRSLHLSWSGDKNASYTEGSAEEVMKNLEPHMNLEKLTVKNYGGLNFPSWMMMLTNLVAIELGGCKRCEHLPPLGHLPKLESLEIAKMTAIKHIVKFDGSQNRKDLFPSLRHLVLSRMPNLERWSAQQVHGDGDGDGDEWGRQRDEEVINLGQLCHLRISDCPNLIQLPQLLLPALEFFKMERVGCDRIDLPMSKSLNIFELRNMPNLERWSSQQEDGDGDAQVIYRFLHFLRICDCPKLIWLPRLLVPDLKFLCMDTVGCDKIELSTSQLLKTFYLVNMPNLEMWSSPEADDDDDEKVINPCLYLSLQDCPKVVRLPHLPSLKELDIWRTNEMLLKTLAGYTSLVELGIHKFPEVIHLPEDIGPAQASSLQNLAITDCPNLISLSYQLENLHSLKELCIVSCPNLVLSLPDGSQEQQRCPPLNSLKKLEICASCEKQTLLPGEGMIMTSLEELRLVECGNLESLSSQGFQNLTNLYIDDCPKVWSSPEWLRNLRSLKNLNRVELDGMMSLSNPLENLNSLEHLFISSGPDMMNFPEWIGSLSSLTNLIITNCHRVRSLPESLENLTLLSHLNIEGCDALTELPTGLQRLTNLRELSIVACPILKRGLRKNWREWKKVAHVPKIILNDSAYSWKDEHPSLMHSLKKGCNEVYKKLQFPSCASASSSSSLTD